jgi:CheY-like chemotaxis protein
MDRRADGLRILVIDDNHDNTFTLSSLLKLKGHQVAAASDGASAIKIAAEFRPQLILLDIGMPRMSGYDVCRELRQSIGGQSIMIVAQTAWGRESDRKAAIDAGFDRHLLKPIDPEDLDHVLELAMARSDSSNS